MLNEIHKNITLLWCLLMHHDLIYCLLATTIYWLAELLLLIVVLPYFLLLVTLLFALCLLCIHCCLPVQCWWLSNGGPLCICISGQSKSPSRIYYYWRPICWHWSRHISHCLRVVQITASVHELTKPLSFIHVVSNCCCTLLGISINLWPHLCLDYYGWLRRCQKDWWSLNDGDCIFYKCLLATK